MSPDGGIYAETRRHYDRALDGLIDAATNIQAGSASDRLELVRLTLHRHLDDVIDAEVLRHPSQGHRVVTPSWAELHDVVRGGVA